MAPPSTRPRLAQIDPDALALDVTRVLIEHVRATLWALYGVGEGPALDSRAEEVAASPLAQVPDAVRQLARYARDGSELDAPVHEYLVTLIPLWSAPIGDADVDGVGDADPGTELGCVIRGALARELVGTPRATLDTTDLAVLAGMSVASVGRLVDAGEIKGRRGDRGYQIAAKEALRWLAARGAPGFRG